MNYLCRILILLFLILIVGISQPSYGAKFITMYENGTFGYIQDPYKTNIEEDIQLANFVNAWCSRNNSINETFMYYRIRNFIARRTTYVKSGFICYSAYGAFSNREAVCMGYSLLAKKFFDAKRIQNVLVHDRKLNHMYNLVRLDGIWTHADITWFDKD